MLKSNCFICESKKCQFIKNTIGKGIGDSITNAIGKVGELHLPANKGEYVPNGSFNNLQKYSYCGPGTKYEQRNRQSYVGINELDKMCKLHDQFCNKIHDTSNRNISDLALAHRANEIANDPRFDSRQRKDAQLVSLIMKNKARFGLGVKSKQKSKVKQK